MHTLLKSRRCSDAVAPIGALFLAAALAAPCLADSDEDAREKSWAAMRQALRVLWTGSPAERRKAANNASSVFHPLFGAASGRDGHDAVRILDSLRSWLRLERDEYISYLLLGELAPRNEENLTPLYRDALKSRSPNLMWRGVRWFAARRDAGALPELQYAWRHEERPWVRADLMIALARQGSSDDSREFLDLAQGRDAVLAVAAIRALAKLGDPEAVPVLAKIARTARSDSALLALDALALWPDSRRAFEAILEASRSPHLEFQRHAALLLGIFDDPAARARARELVTAPVDPLVRTMALGAMYGEDPSVLVPLTLQVLEEHPTQENASIQSAAMEILGELDDPSVLPRLAGLEFADEDGRSFELSWLQAHLGRERVNPPSRPARRSIKDEGLIPDIVFKMERPETFVIVPPPSALTVRCWEYPDVPGDPKELRRLPAGMDVKVNDHFETDDESWVRIDHRDCWLPRRFTGEPAASRTLEREAKEEKTMFIRHEFDLPAIELESDVAQGLMDAGLLEVIEPGDEVIGVAIGIDPEDFERVLLLAKSCGPSETILDGEIYEIVTDLAPLYRGHPVLDRFRRTHPAAPGETDDVIDLDLEELSDR